MLQSIQGLATLSSGNIYPRIRKTEPVFTELWTIKGLVLPHFYCSPEQKVRLYKVMQRLLKAVTDLVVHTSVDNFWLNALINKATFELSNFRRLIVRDLYRMYRSGMCFYVANFSACNYGCGCWRVRPMTFQHVQCLQEAMVQCQRCTWLDYLSSGRFGRFYPLMIFF